MPGLHLLQTRENEEHLCCAVSFTLQRGVGLMAEISPWRFHGSQEMRQGSAKWIANRWQKWERFLAFMATRTQGIRGKGRIFHMYTSSSDERTFSNLSSATN